MPRAGTRVPAAERKKKEIVDAIAYAFGHWIRLEALAILAEGKASVAEIARIIGISVNRLSGHIRGLYEHGCIEYMGTGMSRNANEHYYRALMLPHISDEEFRDMAPVERRESLGIVTQAIIAETLAALRAGRFDDDENARVIGRCLLADARGKIEVQDHVLSVYEQLVDIKVANAHRLARSGETGTTAIISATGFERNRPHMPHMPHAENPSALEIAKGQARRPATDWDKEVADSVAYAAGNSIRVAALEVLAEGKISVSEVARAIGVDLKGLSDHIRYLYDYGRIEKAGIEEVRNTNKHFYRAVTLPCISPEDYQAMSPRERRDVMGLITQSILVETLASFRARKMENDEKVQLIWDCLRLDGKGPSEVASCLTKGDQGLLAIKAANTKRLAKSGEKGIPMVATLIGFERSRPGRPTTGYDSPRKI
jgi:DNA-binding transcriptional ArsR family regulator